MGEKGVGDRGKDTALGNDAAQADRGGTVSSRESVSVIQIRPALLNVAVHQNVIMINSNNSLMK